MYGLSWVARKYEKTSNASWVRGFFFFLSFFRFFWVDNEKKQGTPPALKVFIHVLVITHNFNLVLIYGSITSYKIDLEFMLYANIWKQTCKDPVFKSLWSFLFLLLNSIKWTINKLDRKKYMGSYIKRNMCKERNSMVVILYSWV